MVDLNNSDNALDPVHFFDGFLVRRIVRIKQSDGEITLRAVRHIVDVIAGRRNRCGDRGDHIRDVEVKNDDPVASRSRHRDGRVIDAVDNVAVFEVIIPGTRTVSSVGKSVT